MEYQNDSELVPSLFWNTTEHTSLEFVNCIARHRLSLAILNIVLGSLSMVINSVVLRLSNHGRESSFHVHRFLVAQLISSYLVVAACWVVIWALALGGFSRCGQWYCLCSSGLLVLVYNVGVLASLLHILAMAVEHYLALFRPLAFKELVSRRRVVVLAATSLWVMATLGSASSFSQAVYTYISDNADNRTFCDLFSSESSDRVLHFILLAVLSLSAVVLACIYLRVCLHGSSPAATKSHQTLLTTTLLIWGTFVVCWAPFMVLTLKESTHHSRLAEISCRGRLTMMYLAGMPVVNSLCGPVIYTFRTHCRCEDRAACVGRRSRETSSVVL